MSNKNEVFEYLIDQLRQQVNKKDVTSFNVSVQISDLDEVKQVIHNLQQHIAGKDDEIRALKDSLRQQVSNNPYKQQCEDLAHEVLSLKNQLRDMSELVDALMGTITLMNGDVEAYKVLRKGGYGSEQSGCRKEDAQESCWIEWSGGACPVPSGTLVDVIYRDGETLYGLRADEFNDTKRDASSSLWQHDGALNDIVRYRKAPHQ